MVYPSGSTRCALASLLRHTRPASWPNSSAPTRSKARGCRTPPECSKRRCVGSAHSSCGPPTTIASPAGGALAVDRDLFAGEITELIKSDPLIELIEQEATEIPAEGPVILASGPLTSETLTENLLDFTGRDYMYFYDAIAPIVDAASVDMDIAFIASRYGKGEAAYINCPMHEDQYNTFYDALLGAEKTLHADYDPKELFEGCLPVEVIAARGKDSLRFGPMKPVGLEHPETRERYHAVVQLRPENNELTMYNLVGFQTSLRYPEQKRVFTLIPGLENAEFLRYGAIHRNTFVNAPTLLKPTFQSRTRDDLLFGGQITGVEGYVPSTASGWLAGVNAARLIRGEDTITMPPETILGALAQHICNAEPEGFQPMNANFGLLPPMEKKRGRSRTERRQAQGQRCLEALDAFIQQQPDLLVE